MKPVTTAPSPFSKAPWVATTLGLLLTAQARPAAATNYTITVDAGKQTGSMPRFWTESVGTGTASLTLRADLQTHYKLGNRELGMQRVRGHGVLNDDIGIYKSAGSYDFTKFDVYLNAIVSAGMRPIMELSFMPTALAKNGDSRDIPKDLTAYKQFIQAVVQHCVDKYGAADVGKWYWEVWNEPDYPGFWNGTINDYYALYDAAVDGATAVLPNILIGGPATTEPSKIGAFLQHCKSANKRVTFASSHSYPGGDGTATANAANLVSDNTTRVSQITGAGYTTANVKSFNTEWNSAYSGQGGKVGDSNESMDSHVNAPFIIKAVKLLADKVQGETPPLDVFSYWVMTDVFGEYNGDAGSYIQSKGETLPFGQVFGLMTYQGIRKAAFNGFKMLNYLGPKRLMSGGGTGSDGVDALATVSASGDEVQILVYNSYATIKSSGSDSVTVNVSNLPFAGKSMFVTHFRVDDGHSNPYGVWLQQNKPTKPTDAQWEAMRKAQHLALLEPVSTMAAGASYTTTLTLPRQAASLIILGTSRPVTGRNALVEIEGEDYDAQSGVTKEDSKDTGLGQSIAGAKGAFVSFENVDFSDGGVSSIDLRVSAASATTLELRADAPDGALLGTCAIAATAGSWATQACAVNGATGVHRLLATFGGSLRLNWLKGQAGGGGSGTGGAVGSGGAGATGSGGSGGTASGGSNGSGSGGATGSGGSNSTGSGGNTSGGSGGTTAGTGGGIVTGSGGGPAGSGGNSGSGGSGSGGQGSGGAVGSGGNAETTSGHTGSGCSCALAGTGGPSGAALWVGLFVAGFRFRRRGR